MTHQLNRFTIGLIRATLPSKSMVVHCKIICLVMLKIWVNDSSYFQASVSPTLRNTWTGRKSNLPVSLPVLIMKRILWGWTKWCRNRKVSCFDNEEMNNKQATKKSQTNYHSLECASITRLFKGSRLASRLTPLFHHIKFKAEKHSMLSLSYF